MKRFMGLSFAAILALAAVCAIFAPAAAAAVAAGGTAEYIVQPGDTLTGIAVRFGLTAGQIMDANPAILDANNIVSGQVIILPAGRSEGPIVRPKRLFRWEVEENGFRVVRSDHLVLVRAGDNYIRVARRYGISVDAFFAANPQIAYKADLRKGELVHIPVDLLDEGVYSFYETP